MSKNVISRSINTSPVRNCSITISHTRILTRIKTILPRFKSHSFFTAALFYCGGHTSCSTSQNFAAIGALLNDAPEYHPISEYFSNSEAWSSYSPKFDLNRNTLLYNKTIIFLRMLWIANCMHPKKIVLLIIT